MIQTTLDFGTRTLVISVKGCRVWKDRRIYFDFEVDGKANPLHTLYEVIDGGTRDHNVTVDGRLFGYEYGFCDSKTKYRAVDGAVRELVEQLANYRTDQIIKLLKAGMDENEVWKFVFPTVSERLKTKHEMQTLADYIEDIAFTMS